MIKAIITDIEGTTSSIAFVKDVLFPYAAEHIVPFIQANQQDPKVAECLHQVATLSGLAEDDIVGIGQQLLSWIAEDQKVTPLKTLQGMIWKKGYEQGDYQAHVYQDVKPQLEAWLKAGLKLYVYSSGSVAAQQLFFKYSTAGDITSFFTGHFDTKIGDKKQADAYNNLLQQIPFQAEEVLFLSDVKAELDAARQAGIATIWLRRPEDNPLCNNETSDHLIATNFTGISGLI